MTYRLFIRCYCHFRNINNCTVATMGRRKLKYDLRKNYETKLKVSIPLDKLKVLPLHLSLPLSAYANAPVSNGQHLGERLRATTLLPRGWSVAGGADTTYTTIYKVQCSASGRTSTCSVLVNSDLTWKLTMGSTSIIPTQVPIAPSSLTCLQQVIDLLVTVDRSKLCIGNPDEQYSCLLHHQDNLYDQSGKFINHNIRKTTTVNHWFNK